MHRGGIAFLATGALVLAAAAPASAVTFTVDTTKDGVDANTADTTCATAAGKCTLRAAIDEANATGGDDDIALPAGTLELTRPPGAAASNSGGDLYITEAVRIEGEGRNRTVIEQTVRDRVLFSNAGVLFEPVQLSGVTITGGRLTAPGNQFGGGIRTEDGALLLNRVNVRSNLVDPDPVAGNSGGGGIMSVDSILLLFSTTVGGNRVEISSETGSATGGGIRADGGTLGISKSVVKGNEAEVIGGGESSGGGIYANGETSINGTTVAGNVADNGGGIDFGPIDGGLAIETSTISRNEAREGGGLNLGADIAMDIVNTTISGNSAPRGSAVYAVFGDIDLSHVTVAANVGHRRRGAIRIDDLFDPPVIDLSLAGSIVFNKGRECGGNVAGITAEARNVIGDAGCSDPPVTDDDIADPLLKPLADNGGPTRTHAIKPASGANGLVPSCPWAADQRGEPRAFGMPCDSGAFERP